MTMTQEERIERQHAQGKMTANERIETLLDKDTFVELDKHVVHNSTNFGMEKTHVEGDGVVSGYGKIGGRRVFVYAYDFTVYGGTLSASNAKKILSLALNWETKMECLCSATAWPVTPE